MKREKNAGMRNVRVVLDCNVIVSAARAEGVCREVVRGAIRCHQIFLSHPVVAEYEKIARRPKHGRYRDELRVAIKEIKQVATIVEPAVPVFQIKDPDDEVYLATATAGNAILVTGNRRDFTEPKYGVVEVLSPRAFLERVD